MSVDAPSVPARPRSGSRRRLALIACIAALASFAFAAQAHADVYWTNIGAGKIVRSDSDFNTTDTNFITGLAEPFAVSVGPEYIYWSALGNNAIGRADLEGNNVEPEFIKGVENVYGIAIGPDHLYWTSEGTESIESATLSGTEVEEFAEASEPRSIAYADGHVYWTEN